jgi:hypothetical protein
MKSSHDDAGACNLDGNYTLTDVPVSCQDGQSCTPTTFSLWVNLINTNVCNTTTSVATMDDVYSVAAVPANPTVRANDNVRLVLC